MVWVKVVNENAKQNEQVQGPDDHYSAQTQGLDLVYTFEYTGFSLKVSMGKL